MNWKDYPVVFGAYQGRSFFPSRLIRWFTDSKYSHIAIYRQDRPDYGQVVEAWPDHGVEAVRSFDQNHKDKTKVELFAFRDQPRPDRVEHANNWLDQQIGKAYDWRGVIRFLMRARNRPDENWFCSELAQAYSMELGSPVVIKPPYKVAPCDIPQSTILVKVGELTTRKA